MYKEITLYQYSINKIYIAKHKLEPIGLRVQQRVDINRNLFAFDTRIATMYIINSHVLQTICDSLSIFGVTSDNSLPRKRLVKYQNV